MIYKRLLTASVFVAMMALTGCFTAPHSLIAPEQAVMTIVPGSYCEYDSKEDNSGFVDTCNPVQIKLAENNSYLVTEPDGLYEVRVDKQRLDKKYMAGYLAEACSRSKLSEASPKACDLGLLVIQEGGAYVWVSMECTAEFTEGEECPVTTLAEARRGVTEVTRVMSMRRYVPN